jgi:hypothetical protein
MTTPAPNYSQLVTVLQQLVNQVQSLMQQFHDEGAGGNCQPASIDTAGSDGVPISSRAGYIDIILVGAGGGGGGGYDTGGSNGTAGRPAPITPIGGPTLTWAGEAQAA